MRQNGFILGLSCFYHDSSAVLLKGSRIIAAVQEERFTRKKFDNKFPDQSIKYCLQAGGITPSDLSVVAFYEDPVVKLDRLFSTQTIFAPLRVLQNARRIKRWMDSKFDVETYIVKGLPGFRGDICFYHHHLSHAASAFYPSIFDKATILTLDSIGEWASSTIGIGEKTEIELLKEQRFPHSIGLLYSAFTQYIGFKVDSGEYKLMGLAPYGKPVFSNLIKDHLVKIAEDGSIVLNTDYFDFMTGNRMTNERFHELFGGEPRKPDNPITYKDMDIAASIQQVVEEILIKMATQAVRLTGVRNLCMAGGVALNCVANGKILKSGLVDNLWVQPASGDCGGALGAALLAAYQHLALERHVDSVDSQQGSLLGPSYSCQEIKKLIELYGLQYEEIEWPAMADYIAEVIAQGKVVGFFQGRMEYGPRALGARSILGDPRNPQMQRVMNLKIKFRESFRPFAPMVLKEKADQWFEMSGDSPYMLLTFPIKKDKRRVMSCEQDGLLDMDKLNIMRSEIPAVTHIDYSARVQTVDKENNPRAYEVLQAFDKKTGCPVLINTSFNVRGEPIVCTPLDALKCFVNTNMDVLAIENFILHRENQNNSLKDPDFKNHFEPD